MRFIYAQDNEDPSLGCAINVDKIVRFFTVNTGEEWQLIAQTTQKDNIILCCSDRGSSYIPVSVLKEIISDINQPFLNGNIYVNKKIEAMSE